MNAVALIGIDLGKHSFHLHAQDEKGRMVFRKKVLRSQILTVLGNVPACDIVMEACAGAPWMARQLAGLGHDAKLISPQFVKPFVPGNKNDFADAQAICEAASRPSRRFVSPRNESQQTVSALHRVREGLVRDRTATLNPIHGFLLEFGISIPTGAAVITQLPTRWAAETTLPPRLVTLIERLRAHYQYLDQHIHPLEQDLMAQLQEDDRSRRLWKFLASVRSPPVRSPLNWVMPGSLPMPGNLPRRLAGSPVSTAPGANRRCSASANGVIRTCADYGCNARAWSCKA